MHEAKRSPAGSSGHAPTLPVSVSRDVHLGRLAAGRAQLDSRVRYVLAELFFRTPYRSFAAPIGSIHRGKLSSPQFCKVFLNGKMWRCQSTLRNVGSPIPRSFRPYTQTPAQFPDSGRMFNDKGSRLKRPDQPGRSTRMDNIKWKYFYIGEALMRGDFHEAVFANPHLT